MSVRSKYESCSSPVCGVSWLGLVPGGRGALRFEWVPTAKWPHGAETVKPKWGSQLLLGQKRGAVNFKVRT